MGREARCTLRSGGKSTDGKALLETKEILFRGGDVRVTIPFDTITKLSVSGDALQVSHGGGESVLVLGEKEAARWAEKIKNPPSLADKLGVKAGARVLLVGEVGRDRKALEELLAARGADVSAKPRKDNDFVFVSVEEPEDLARLAEQKPNLKSDGALWVVRPKGKVVAVTERAVMAAGKQAGLVDVKVAAYSPTHTAEKYVIPLSGR
jgi:hypothetical protein